MDTYNSDLSVIREINTGSPTPDQLNDFFNEVKEKARSECITYSLQLSVNISIGSTV
jgi:hypothetical protein